jgi:NDP-sugar pyrophosphorylase family protein
MISRVASSPRMQPGYHASGESIAHESVQTGSHVRLVGPVVIGPGVVLGDRVTIVGPSTIGAGTRIEQGALVSRSVLWDNCLIGPEAVVDRCLLADEASVRPGRSLFSALKASASDHDSPSSARHGAHGHASSDGAGFSVPVPSLRTGSV